MSAAPTSPTPSTSGSRSPSPEVEAVGGGRWLPEEDTRLRAAVQELGEKGGKDGAWKQIAELVGGGRTDKSCRKRWTHSLDPSLRKGRWTAEEDQILLQHHARLGNRWHEISGFIPGRKADQVAKRYRDTLNPELDRQEWTAEEDSVLLAAYNQVGPLWTVICAKVGPGRSGMHVRNRFRALTKASSPGVARRDSDGSRERSSAAGPSRTKRSTASTSAAGRSRSPHTRPEPSRATSVPSTTGGDSVSSPFDFDKYYAALASPAPYPIPFDPTCGTSTSPFTDVELAFLRNYPPPSDATDNATEWARMQGLSPPIWPLTEQPVVSQAPSTHGFSICTHCHGSGFVPSQSADFLGVNGSVGQMGNGNGVALPPPGWTG